MQTETSRTRQYWGGGGGGTEFLTNVWHSFDQLSKDLILTNQCLFKANFSGEVRVGVGQNQNHRNRENVRRQGFRKGPRYGRVF